MNSITKFIASKLKNSKVYHYPILTSNLIENNDHTTKNSRIGKCLKS